MLFDSQWMHFKTFSKSSPIGFQILKYSDEEEEKKEGEEYNGENVIHPNATNHFEYLFLFD